MDSSALCGEDIADASRSNSRETSSTKPFAGVQGEGRTGRPEGRDESLAVLAERFDLHANQITQWKNQLVAQAAAVFAAESPPGDGGPPVDLKALHAKIGQQALEIDFLAGALGRLPGPSARR